MHNLQTTAVLQTYYHLRSIIDLYMQNLHNPQNQYVFHLEHTKQNSDHYPLHTYPVISTFFQSFGDCIYPFFANSSCSYVVILLSLYPDDVYTFILSFESSTCHDISSSFFTSSTCGLNCGS